MIKLYKDQKISIYKIQKELGLPINTPFLYNYANGKRSIKNMDIDTLIKISYILKEEPNELYKKILDYEKRKTQKGTINGTNN